MRLDDKMDITNIRLFGLLDFFSLFGGLASFMFKLGREIVRFLFYDYFIAQILGMLFTIKTLIPIN